MNAGDSMDTVDAKNTAAVIPAWKQESRRHGWQFNRRAGAVLGVWTPAVLRE